MRVWYWQGLRWVPAGGLLLASAAVAGLSAPGRWLGWLVAAVLCARLYRVIDLFYAARFRARPAGNRGWLVAVAALVGALFVDAYLRPPVLLAAAVSAGVILLFNGSTGGGRPHHRWGVGLLADLALLPLAVERRTAVVSWLAAAGGLGVVLGTLDHRELVRRPRGPRVASCGRSSINGSTRSGARW